MNEKQIKYGRDIALLIRELCKEHDITVQEMEKKCGLGNGSVARWEKGSIPRVSALIPVCDFFNVSLDYLTSRSCKPETLEEWNRKYNVERLAEEARFYDTLGKLKGLFHEIGIVELTEKDIELLNQYLKVLKK